MTAPAATPFPGPAALGRNVIVGADQQPPGGFHPDAPRVVIDGDVLDHPGPAVAFLHGRWARREPTIIELAVGNEELRDPETDDRAPWQLPRGFTFLSERLAFLVWANSWDARSGDPVWWDAELAVRGGASPGDGDTCDVVVDGQPAWCDGGPRGPLPVELDGVGLLHRETIRAHRRQPDRFPLRLLDDAEPTAELADDQLTAVTHPAGAARIIAPAGSGKTRVLTARLRHLLRGRAIEPTLVTAVAYNRRAAEEMRSRLDGLPANIRTLHSLGLWICNLADGNDRRALINEREQRSILDRLVRTGKVPNRDPFQPWLDALTEVRLGLRDPEAVGILQELDDFPEVFDKYRAELDRRNQTDFDEQVYRAIELLLADPGLRQRVQQVGTHLLVDEFQDLTPAFHLLIRLVASPGLQVFAVGDDDQVIYGYAGADPEYLIEYAAEFPGAGNHPLQVNYRCPPAVVSAVDRLLTHNTRRVAKQIRAGRTEPASAPAEQWDAGVVLHGVDAGAMASRAVATIQERLDAGAKPHEIAVLARVNATLLPVQVALGEAGIARTAPLDDRVIGRTGVRTALAYLRMGLDLERIRREDIFDTINRPSRKVKSAVYDHLHGQRFSLVQLRQITDVLSTTHADRWQGYLDDLLELEKEITNGADTERVLWVIRNHIGLGDAMATLDSARSRPEGSSHGDDLDALDQLAALHTDPATFREWLVDAMRQPGQDTGVTLSTVHRVKGMEWDNVVVFAANNGLFPHRLSDQPEEERRVFHVAVTRCRETVAVIHDRTAASPFLPNLTTPPKPADARVSRTGTGSASQKPADARVSGGRRPRDPLTGRVIPADARVSRDGGGANDGRATVEEGLELTAPGGVAATVVRVDRERGETSLTVAVNGAWAPLALDAPVTIDGDPATLQLPTRRKARAVAPPTPVGRATLTGTEEAELDGPAAERFEALRSWRIEQARSQEVPAYIVFNDTHLREIARRRPDTLAELAACPGVGPKKLELYGDEVLEVLAS